jgi:hypothetical protein
MRDAVRVDRDALDPLDLALAQGALDGGAGLSAVQGSTVSIRFLGLYLASDGLEN